MQDDEKTKEQLIDELNEMRSRVAELLTQPMRQSFMISSGRISEQDA